MAAESGKAQVHDVTTKDVFLFYFWKLLVRIILLPYYLAKLILLVWRGQLISQSVRNHEVTRALLLILRFLVVNVLIRIVKRVTRVLWFVCSVHVPKWIAFISVRGSAWLMERFGLEMNWRINEISFRKLLLSLRWQLMAGLQS